MLLAYRVPREPSTPRIAIWRRLNRIGVAQLGDGLVALPQDARTQEQLEWVAEQVDEAGGRSTLWSAQALSQAQERAVIAELAAVRGVEYAAVVARVGSLTDAERVELARGLRVARRELRAIERRDHFPPVEREQARQAVAELAARARATDALVEQS